MLILKLIKSKPYVNSQNNLNFKLVRKLSADDVNLIYIL